MKFRFLIPAFLLLCALPCGAQDLEVGDFDVQKAVSDLWNEGYMNVRAVEDSSSIVISLENDLYKLQASGFAHAVEVLERQGFPEGKKVDVIGLYQGIPQVTMQYQGGTDGWTATSRVKSWSKIKDERPVNSTFGKVDIVVYPQISIMNLVINQVYQSLWQISPAVEVSLWKGAKFSYQVKIPLFNDGYGTTENVIHPGMITLSQRFRDPWGWNITGRVVGGVFNNSRCGIALDMKYVFPNERFSVDAQFGMLGVYYWKDWVLHFDTTYRPRWSVAGNFYWPQAKTQFTLRAQQFLYGEIGAKFEMVRHFRYCSIGFYAEKAPYAHTNGGFRFQIAMPPYRHPRQGRLPRLTTSGQMGLVYNANNERYYYKEYRMEASDNIMEANGFNPLYIQSEIKSLNR